MNSTVLNQSLHCAACPPAHGRNRLTKSPRNSATAGFIFFAFVCVVMCGGALAAGSQAHPSPPSLTESLDVISKFFMGGIGAALIWVVRRIPSSVRKIAAEEIAAAHRALAEKSASALPQPLVVSPEDPYIKHSAFKLHCNNNSDAHKEFFNNQRKLEERLRGEIKTSITEAVAGIKADIHDLREADKSTSEILGAEMRELTGKVGELIGRLAKK